MHKQREFPFKRVASSASNVILIYGFECTTIHGSLEKGFEPKNTSVWTGFQNVPANSKDMLELKYPTQEALARPEILRQKEIRTTDERNIHHGVPNSGQSPPTFTRSLHKSKVEALTIIIKHVYTCVT